MKFPSYYSKKTSQFYELKNDMLIAATDKIPVKNGIPRFVGNENYASAFGEQWKKYRTIQLDSHIGEPISRTRMERYFGTELFSQLKGSTVLEAGCGAGRFTEVLLEEGAYVTSFDLSDAVDANVLNAPIDDTHRIFQGDITAIPFKEQQYDFVVCLGVIQHTPNPEKTIEHLFQQVKPCGSLIIDHYTYTLSYYTKTTGILRFFIKRLSPEKGMKVTEKITNIFFPLHKAVRKVYPLQALLSRISPIHAYFFAHPNLKIEDQYQLSLLDTHDSLTDWYKHHRTKGQLSKFLEKIGGINVYAAKSPHGIDARCDRPSR